jgi:hypothetical protein
MADISQVILLWILSTCATSHLEVRWGVFVRGCVSALLTYRRAAVDNIMQQICLRRVFCNELRSTSTKVQGCYLLFEGQLSQPHFHMSNNESALQPQSKLRLPRYSQKDQRSSRLLKVVLNPRMQQSDSADKSPANVVRV